MKIKGFHFDLKAQMLRFDRLLQAIHEIADLGFNTILLEYQDKFPYSGDLACLAAPDALTPEQITQIKALCGQRNIAIIPMVQCIGHMYWVTRHTPFQHLGEHYPEKGPGSHSLCASNAESLSLFYKLSQQLFQMHADSTYFHIGGDEVKFFDRCPLCGGKDHGELLGNYYRAALSHVSKNGYTPVMWGDMVVKYAQIAEYLPKDTLIMDWEYHKGLSAANRKRFYRDMPPLCDADDSSFANTPKLIAQGFSVLTTPALRSMGDSCFLPRNIHLDNCVQGFYTARDAGAAGIMVTSWSVRRSPWHLTRPVLYAVAALFRDEAADCTAAMKRYGEKAFGKADISLAMIPFRLAEAIEQAKQTADFLSSGQDFMDPETGMFLSDSIEKRLKGLDIRHNTALQDAYSHLHTTSLSLKEQLATAGCTGEDTAMLHWALDNAIFMGRYVSQLCTHFDDRRWLENMLSAFDGFARQTELLRQYYTDFSMPSEHQSRIGIHKDYLQHWLRSIS